MQPLVLASQSAIRAELLRRTRVPFETSRAAIDEETVKAALLAEEATAREIADALAEAKAKKVSSKYPDKLVLGCDQVLDFEGRLLSKPASPEDAIAQLVEMSGRQHQLLSAAVICEAGKPVWRHIGVVRLHMHDHSRAWLEGYVTRNWESIRHAVGCYKLEEEGPRLFTRIDGDHFNVLGLPLLELLSYLGLRGTLDR